MPRPGFPASFAWAASPREGSFLAESAQDVPATAAAMSFTDPGVSRPVNLREDRLAGPPQANEDPWRPSVVMQALLVCMALYFAPAVALFQQYYKDMQRLSGGEQCEELWAKVVEGLEGTPPTREIPTSSSVIFEGLERLRRDSTSILREELSSVATGRRLEGMENATPGPRGSGAWEAALEGFWGVEMVRVSKATAGPSGVYFDAALQRRGCRWYLAEVSHAPRRSFLWQERERELCGGSALRSRRHCETKPACRHAPSQEAAPPGEQGPGCFFKDCAPGHGRRCYAREIHSYDKGVALFLQSLVAAFVHWAWAFFAGGRDLLRSCFHFSRMRRFAVVGCLFGFSSVFGFLAQAKLTPASYLIIGQSTIIVVPVIWRIIFRTPIPTSSWLHISMTAFGMYMYFLADMEASDGQDSFFGIVFAFIKVGMSAIAAVNTDRYLKTLSDIPFPVQVSYILPFKALSCLATSFILPPHRFPPVEYRPGWAFHDMSFAVALVLFHSLGDTVLSGAVVKVFDSVAKALIAVIGIIFPTWVVSYWLGWDAIEWSTDQGKLKVTGAIIVIAMAFGYILGRSQARELSSQTEVIAEMHRRHRHLTSTQVMQTAPVTPPAAATVSAKKVEVMAPAAALSVGMPAMVCEGRWKPEADGKWRPQRAPQVGMQAKSEASSEQLLELAEAELAMDEETA